MINVQFLDLMLEDELYELQNKAMAEEENDAFTIVELDKKE